MKPIAIKVLKFVYALSFVPLLVAGGCLYAIFQRQLRDNMIHHPYIGVSIYYAVMFLVGIYLGIPHIWHRIQEKKIQFSLFYLIGCIALVFASLLTFIPLYSDIGSRINMFFYNLVGTTGVTTFLFQLPLSMTFAGFFLTKAF